MKPMAEQVICPKCSNCFNENEGEKSERWFPNIFICGVCKLQERNELKLIELITKN